MLTQLSLTNIKSKPWQYTSLHFEGKTMNVCTLLEATMGLQDLCNIFGDTSFPPLKTSLRLPEVLEEEEEKAEEANSSSTLLLWKLETFSNMCSFLL